MIVPGSANPLLLRRSGAGGGYSIANSLRYRAINSANLTRTLVAGNRNLWSIGWQGVKRGTLGTLQYLYGADTASADAIYFDTSDRLCIDIAGTVRLVTNAVFRDPSGHYAIKVDFDAANGTAANRLILTVNGTVLTSFSTDTRSGITSGTAKTGTAVTAYYGRNPTSAANYFDGLMANCWHVNGVLAGAQGQIDATSGAWVPTTPNGMTNNSAGWLLEFSNATSTTTISQDSTSNGVNWTSSGISVTAGVTFDQLIDTPTNGAAGTRPVGNYAALSQLTITGGEVRGGGMRYINTSGGTAFSVVSTVPLVSGNDLTYIEITINAAPFAGYPYVGLWHPTTRQLPCPAGQIAGFGAFSDFGQGASGGYYINNAFTSNSNSYTTNDVVMFAFKRSTGEVWMGKNGTWWNSGNPSSQTSPYVTLTADLDWWFSIANFNSTEVEVNFGQKPFVHTVPTNFRGLCSANISSAAVLTSGSFTGNASTNGASVWINGNPATLTINGNPVTFGTDADKTAGGFKLRTASASYNASGTNNWTATVGNRFRGTNGVSNNAQVNP